MEHTEIEIVTKEKALELLEEVESNYQDESYLLADDMIDWFTACIAEGKYNSLEEVKEIAQILTQALQIYISNK